MTQGFPLFTVDPALDGPTNMTRDSALIDQLTPSRPLAARVYTWDGPWVTLGCFQSPDRDLLPGSPVPWVMRPTGGKGVLHGHDLTVGLAASMDLLLKLHHTAGGTEGPERLLRSVTTVYRIVCRPLVTAIRSCGTPAVLGEEYRDGAAARGPHTSDCFAHVSPNDIADERTGRKVCGCALKLSPQGVLVQASIPIGPPLVDPASVYPEPAEVGWSDIALEPFAEALESALGSLSASSVHDLGPLAVS